VWEESYIVPLFKSRDKRNISNCRVIFILSAIPELFPLISDEQHGFVGGRSTVTGLMEFSIFVLSEMKEGSRSMRFIQTFRKLSIE
jgi:hypothetical protein